MKYQLVCVFLLLSACLRAGEYANAFLEGGITGRSVAMANTIGCLDYSATAGLSNPAGLAYLNNTQLGFLYASQFGLANYNYLFAGLPVSAKTKVALAWVRFSVDDIPIRPDLIRQVPDKEQRRDTLNILWQQPWNTFSDNENAFFISLGRLQHAAVNLGWRYSQFGLDYPWGLNFKIIYKSLYNLKGFGLGVDWGGRLRANGEELLDITDLGFISVGLTIQDIAGTTIYWNTKSQDRIPPALLWSAALEQPIARWKTQVNLAWAYDLRYDDKSRFGAEIAYDKCLFLRLGLKNTGISAGLGLNFKLVRHIIQLDYAFYHHELGMNHRVGASIEF